MKQFGIYGSVETPEAILFGHALVINKISVSSVSDVPTVSDTPEIATVSRLGGGKRQRTG